MAHRQICRWSYAAVREPLIHFLLLGAAIYALAGLVGSAVEPEVENRIHVTVGEVAWITQGWEKRWNRPPTPEERAGLIDEYVRETVLYREALAMGLDRDDTIIRRRLAQKLEFLTQDLVATVPPTDEELHAYFAEHAGRYAGPALTTFTQVFVDPDLRGDATLDDAERILAELRALDAPTEGTAALGDPFMLQPYYPQRSEVEIAKLFGSEFARQVVGLAPGTWHGPVLSGYGVHLVHVDGHVSAVPAEFGGVRERVLQDWEEERRQRFQEEYYAALRARYEVVIDEPLEGDDYAAIPQRRDSP